MKKSDAEQLNDLRNAVFALCGHLPGVSQEEQLAMVKDQLTHWQEQARLGWERHAEKDAVYEVALTERDQWREVAERLAPLVKEVCTSHRDWDSSDYNECDKPGEQCHFCDQGLAALSRYDALAKLSEKR